MTTWQRDDLTFDPAYWPLNPLADEIARFTVTGLLVNSGAPSLPQARLYNAATDAEVTLVDGPALDGTTAVTMRLRNVPAGLYRLWIGFTTSGNVRWGKVYVESKEL